LASIESTAELQLRRFLLFGWPGGCVPAIWTPSGNSPGASATRLPGAPEWVRGLINLRGSLVTVVDLAVRFGSAEGASARSIIVVEAAGSRSEFPSTRCGTCRRWATTRSNRSMCSARRVESCVTGHVGVQGAETALVVDVEEIANRRWCLRRQTADDRRQLQTADEQTADSEAKSLFERHRWPQQCSFAMTRSSCGRWSATSFSRRLRSRWRGRDRSAGRGTLQAAASRPRDDGHRDARHGRNRRCS